MPFPGVRDGVTRARLQAQEWGVTWTRFKLYNQPYRTAAVRFVFGAITTNRRYTAARYRLTALNYAKGVTRFRLGVLTFRHTLARFNLAIRRDGVSRFRLLAQNYRNTRVRFLLVGGFRATLTRFNLVASLRNTVTRLIIRASKQRDAVCRFVVAAMTYEQFANSAASFLSLALSNSAASNTLTVSNSAVFPKVGIFRILVDQEIMVVYEVHGTKWFVGRGAEGTALAAHHTGTNVYQIITAGALENLYSEPLIDTVTGQFVYDSATGDILVGKPY